MCHFDILTVCHAVTETTPFIYEYIAHTHTHTHLAAYVCVHCVHWNTHVSLGGCSCIVVTWLQKNGAGNLNLCHLLITQTNSLTQTQTLTNIRIHTYIYTHSCRLTVLWRRDLSCMDLCLCFCIVSADIPLFFAVHFLHS